METPQQMRNYRAPGKAPVRPAAASRALGAPAGNAPAKAAAKSPYVGGEILNLPNQGRAEKQNIAGSINRILQANERTAAQPFQQKAGEIGNVEQTVAGRFANVNRGAVGNAQGLLANAEASAKTFENQAAENALTANRAVETAGQNAVTANAGQLPPELRGQLAFNEGQIRGIGAAGEQRANELGANAVAYQRALAAAAVQRGQEGQQNIVNTYGAQRAKNAAEQNRAIERERGKAKEQRITLPQELNKMKLAETLGQGKLAEGQAKLAQGAAKIAQGNVKLAQGQQGLNIKGQQAATQAGAAGSKEAKEAFEIKLKGELQPFNISKAQWDTKQKEADVAYKNLTSQDKAAYDKWRETHGGGKGTAGLTPNETLVADRKITQELNKAYPVVNQERLEGIRKAPKASQKQIYEQTIRQLEEGKHTGKGREPGSPMSSFLIHAALSMIYNQGKLVGRPRQEALELGLSPSSHWLA